MRILLVEDNRILGDALAVSLRQANYSVDWLVDGHTATAAITEESYGMLVLDLNLPGRSGFDVLAFIRQRHINLPVMILSARDTVADRIAGLDAGADDYMIKPFNLGELQARLRALQRRFYDPVSSSILAYKDIRLDPNAYSVKKSDIPILLSRKEFSLLQLLLENIDVVVSRRRIESTLYSGRENIDSNAVEVHIHNLRKKLGTVLIRTIRGIGYMIQAEP